MHVTDLVCTCKRVQPLPPRHPGSWGLLRHCQALGIASAPGSALQHACPHGLGFMIARAPCKGLGPRGWHALQGSWTLLMRGPGWGIGGGRLPLVTPLHPATQDCSSCASHMQHGAVSRMAVSQWQSRQPSTGPQTERISNPLDGTYALLCTQAIRNPLDGDICIACTQAISCLKHARHCWPAVHVNGGACELPMVCSALRHSPVPSLPAVATGQAHVNLLPAQHDGAP